MNIPSIGWMTNQKGQAVFVSQGLVRYTGRTIDESLGNGWLEDIHPDDRKRINALFAKAPDELRPVFFRFQLKHFTGVYSPFSACASASNTPSGEFAGWSVWVSPAGENSPANPLLDLLPNNMREIVCLLSNDARILYISPAVNAVLGYSPSELIGRRFPARLIPSKHREEFMKSFDLSFAMESSQYSEICLPSRSGEMIWLELDLQFLKNKKGELINLQIVARDVSTRKHNEKMLQMQNKVAGILWETGELNQSLNDVLNEVLSLEGVDSGGVYISDPNTHGMELACHIGLGQIFADSVKHFSRNHVLIKLCQKGKPIVANVPVFLNKFIPNAPAAYKTENFKSFAVFPVLYKKILISIFIIGSHSHDQIPPSSLQVIEFITHQIGALITRNQVENALRESEEKFRSFFEQSTDIMSLVDENGVITEWNPTSEALTGLDKTEVVGKKSVDIQFDLLPPDKKSALMYRKMKERYSMVQRYGKGSFLNRILEGQVVDKTGQLHSFQQVIFPIRTRKGIMLGSTGRDVTEIKKIQEAELEQRKLTEALIQSAAVLNGSLILDDIIKSIFVLVEKVVPNQGGALMLINPETGLVRVAGNLGEKSRTIDNYENSFEFPHVSVPVLNILADTRQPIIIPDTQTSKLWKNFHSDQPIRSFLGVPISSKNEVIGFLTLTHTRKDSFQTKHAEWLMAFANQAAMAIDNARLFSQVERLAIQDELTHMYNRRGFTEQGEREVARAQRFNHPLSALFLDVDHFKNINDKYSHLSGDLALRAVASCIHEFLRSVDVAGRYGGEEFVFLLPETDQDGAYLLAERLRTEIEKITIETPQGRLHVTVSIGVACLESPTQTLDELLDKADAAVHRAKASGRNRVAIE